MGFFYEIGRLWRLIYRPLYYLGKIWGLIRFGMKHDNFIVNIYSWGCLSWIALLVLISIDEGDAEMLFVGLPIFGLPTLIPLYYIKMRGKLAVEIPAPAPRIEKVAIEPQKEEIAQPQSVAETIDVDAVLDFPSDLAYVSEEARIFARVENKSDVAIEDATIQARFPDALGVKNDVVHIGFLSPRDVAQGYWAARPVMAGNFAVYKPKLIFRDEKGGEHERELDSLRINVKEAIKSKTTVERTKRGRKALISPWCPECNKYKGREPECPHCGYNE
ncbi:MAG: hypothetical protein V3W19_05115 [Desulfatiglandales bacterium]